MEQIAMVKSILDNGMAQVAVQRETACGAAHSCADCAGCEKMMTRTENVVVAYNDVNAHPWGAADSLPRGALDLPGRCLGRPGGGSAHRKLQSPPGPIWGPGSGIQGIAAGDHASLPGPGKHRLFPAGLGRVGASAGPYSGHGTARCGRGRFYRPVEAAKAPISSSSRVRACRGAHQ